MTHHLAKKKLIRKTDKNPTQIIADSPTASNLKRFLYGTMVVFE